MRDFKIRRLLCCIAAATFSFAAWTLNLPVKNIGGKPYYYYTVDKKDRFYKLPQKLGVSRTTLVRYNPAAAEGIQPGMVITIPVEYDAEIVNGYYTIRYEADKNESIYGLGKRFDVPVDKIIEFNPNATHGIGGLTLTIPLASAPEKESQPTGIVPDGKQYTIHNGETLYAISANNNVTLEELLAANPGLNPNSYRDGTVITIPNRQSVDEESDSGFEYGELPKKPMSGGMYVSPEDINPNEFPVDPDDSVSDTVSAEGEYAPRSVALLLPFGLGQEQQSKATQLITEFYRGFLMGVEKLSHSGSPVSVYAYDSSVSIDSLRQLMGSTEIASADIIVAPDNEEIFREIVSATANTKTKVFNPFVVRNEDYVSNPGIVQAIVPHKQMYRKAVDAFVKNLNGRTPVFLSRIQGQADKAPFVTLLKEQLDRDSIDFKDIAYRDFLTAEALEELQAGSSYVFIPSSGSRIEFNKFAPALKSIKESGVSLSVFGFPEWITFRNETLDALYALDATIYSRFRIEPSDHATKDVERKYLEWFGAEMMDAVPNQGIFGYDIAMFIVNSLRNSGNDVNGFDFVPYQGVQSGFRMVSSGENGGLYNDNLYFLTFVNGGSVRKTIL